MIDQLFERWKLAFDEAHLVGESRERCVRFVYSNEDCFDIAAYTPASFPAGRSLLNEVPAGNVYSYQEYGLGSDGRPLYSCTIGRDGIKQLVGFYRYSADGVEHIVFNFMAGVPYILQRLEFENGWKDRVARQMAEMVVEVLLAKTEKLKVGDGLEPGTDMGPLVTADHHKRVSGYVEKGLAEGAVALCDGRRNGNEQGYFLGPTIFDDVQPEMTIAREEIFGPVLSVIRVKTLDDAIKLVNTSRFGNATSIFTNSGKAAREYSSRVEVGMIGVNVGVAAPMAFFPFAGWKNSFFGDLHAHGKDAVMFYTEQKVLMTRWF